MEALAGLFTGGASLLGTLFTNSQNAQNAQQNNMFNWMMQQQQQAYNTQMSNTQYQRGVTDMKAAGLNPALMFGSGGPAPSPNAGSVSGTVPDVENPGSAISSALQGSKLIPELKNLITSNEQLAKGVEKTGQEIEGQKLENVNKDKTAQILHHETRKRMNEANQAEVNYGTAQQIGRKAKADADLAEMNTEDYRQVGPGDVSGNITLGGKYGARINGTTNLRTVKRTGGTIGSAIGSGVQKAAEYFSPPAEGHTGPKPPARDQGTALRASGLVGIRRRALKSSDRAPSGAPSNFRRAE